jgi:hypothetical protein
LGSGKKRRAVMNRYKYIFTISLLVLVLNDHWSAEATTQELIIADFNTGSQPNNVGGIFGTWDYDPNDSSQSCTMSLEPLNVPAGEQGFSLRLSYDVESVNPAFNGFWMKLEGVNVTPYNRLRFWVRGDSKSEHTSRFKVELKNMLGKRAVYLVNNVSDVWREVVIDFKKNRAIKDWSELSEFTVVFSDSVATQKKGAIFIDNISFLALEERH